MAFIPDAAAGYATKRVEYAGTTDTAPREPRAVEAQLNSARALLEQVNNLNGGLDELRHRLLGLSEPNAPPRDQKESAQLVRAELAELGITLERLHNAMQAMGSKVADLQRI